MRLWRKRKHDSRSARGADADSTAGAMLLGLRKSLPTPPAKPCETTGGRGLPWGVRPLLPVDLLAELFEPGLDFGDEALEEDLVLVVGSGLWSWRGGAVGGGIVGRGAL